MGAVKRCLVVCAAPVGTEVLARCADFTPDLTIAADGGYLRCAELGLCPDLVLGDFDSAPRPQNALVFPSHKDDTDCMLALRAGLERGCKDFLLLGCTGGRLDHTLAAIQSLCWLDEQGACGRMVDERHTLTVLHSGQRLELARGGQYLSVFALGAHCTVTLRGVEYPLTDYPLTDSFPLGVSNHITEPFGQVLLTSGRLLVMTVD